MRKPLVAQQKMKEFDPECERQFPVLVVKIVDPGCTFEVQIENGVTGRVRRITSTEDDLRDLADARQAILEEFSAAWVEFKPPEERE